MQSGWYILVWLDEQTICPGNTEVSFTLPPPKKMVTKRLVGEGKKVKTWVVVQKGGFLSSPRFSVWVSAETRKRTLELGTWVKMLSRLPGEPDKDEDQGKARLPAFRIKIYILNPTLTFCTCLKHSGPSAQLASHHIPEDAHKLHSLHLMSTV